METPRDATLQSLNPIALGLCLLPKAPAIPGKYLLVHDLFGLYCYWERRNDSSFIPTELQPLAHLYNLLLFSNLFAMNLTRFRQVHCLLKLGLQH